MSLLPSSITAGNNMPEDFYFAIKEDVPGVQVISQSGNTVSLSGGGGAVNISTTTAVATSTQKLTGTSYVAGFQSTQFTGQVEVLSGAEGTAEFKGGRLELTRNLINPAIVMSRDDIVGQGSIQFDGSKLLVGPIGISGEIYDSTGSAGATGAVLISGGPSAPWTWGVGGAGATGPTGPKGDPGQSSSFFEYNARLTLTSGNPGNTNIIWNNAAQLSATQINVSHIERGNIDVDVFLEFLKPGDTFIIQDQNQSLNFQEWLITSTTLQVGYVEYGVSYVGGGYSFTGGQNVIFIAFYQGPQGPTGDVGPTGPTGAVGPTGPAPVQSLSQTLSVGNSAGSFNIDMSQNQILNTAYLSMRDDSDDQPTIGFVNNLGVQRAQIDYNGSGGNDKITMSGTTIILDGSNGNLELDAANWVRVQAQGRPIILRREDLSNNPITTVRLEASGQVKIGEFGVATAPRLTFEGVSGNSFSFTYDNNNDRNDVAGLLRFPTTLPQSALVPTLGDQLVNKTYVDGLGSWTSFTPTMTQGVGLTFTTTYAKYCQIGKFVSVQMTLSNFSAGTAGALIVGGFGTLPTAADQHFVGTYNWFDSGNTIYTGAVVGASTTSFQLSTSGYGSYLATGLGGVAMGAGDELRVAFTYELP